MTNQELEKYRIQLFRDAAGMEKKPDRTPLVSFFVTWKILDSPYKLTEAMNDYSKMEQVVRHHQEAYGFDTMFDFGTRNPYRVAPPPISWMTRRNASVCGISISASRSKGRSWRQIMRNSCGK